MRFRAAQRLRRNREFQAVRGGGRRIDAGAFIVWVFRREKADGGYAGPRLGVAASRAVGNAVVRNLAKRRLRELFRRHAERLPGGIDLVVSARKPVAELPFAELDRKFTEVCRKVAASHSNA